MLNVDESKSMQTGKKRNKKRKEDDHMLRISGKGRENTKNNITQLCAHVFNTI